MGFLPYHFHETILIDRVKVEAPVVMMANDQTIDSEEPFVSKR